MAIPPVAVLALNLALDGPKSTASVVSAKDLACRIRQRLGMEAEVPLKTAPWNRQFWWGFGVTTWRTWRCFYCDLWTMLGITWRENGNNALHGAENQASRNLFL